MLSVYVRVRAWIQIPACPAGSRYYINKWMVCICVKRKSINRNDNDETAPRTVSIGNSIANRVIWSNSCACKRVLNKSLLFFHPEYTVDASTSCLFKHIFGVERYVQQHDVHRSIRAVLLWSIEKSCIRAQWCSGWQWCKYTHLVRLPRLQKARRQHDSQTVFGMNWWVEWHIAHDIAASSIFLAYPAFFASFLWWYLLRRPPSVGEHPILTNLSFTLLLLSR